MYNENRIFQADANNTACYVRAKDTKCGLVAHAILVARRIYSFFDIGSRKLLIYVHRIEAEHCTHYDADPTDYFDLFMTIDATMLYGRGEMLSYCSRGPRLSLWSRVAVHIQCGHLYINSTDMDE